MTFSIKKVVKERVEELMRITRYTFIDTYSSHNTPEDMIKYVDTNFNKEQLLSEISSKDSEYYFLEDDSTAKAYIKINFGTAQTDQIIKDAAEIERIYVIPEYKGLGLGKVLINHAQKTAADRNITTIWLGVWEKNTAAITFYYKLGFKYHSEHRFLLGDDLQNDLILTLST